MRELIFIVQSEVAQRMARNALEKAGYSVRALLPMAALEERQRFRAALIIVDGTKPGVNGVEVCRRFRENGAWASTPIVILTASHGEHFFAFESGADDCLTEPFSPRELVARVQSVLRRSPRLQTPPAENADIVIDRGAMRLSVRGAEVTTTSLEFRLLDYLALHPGRVFTRDVLLDAVWGEMQFVTPRSVDACIRRVRRKIEPDKNKPTFLKTVRGVGYRFDAVAGWQD